MIDISRFENEENLLNIMGTGAILNFGYFFLVYAIKFTCFYPILLKLAQIICIFLDINPIENEANPSNDFGNRDI